MSEPNPNAPAPGKRGRKVCIVGFAKTSRDQAPYADLGYEIWGVNDAWSFMARADRWFEVHSTWIYEWELRRAQGHVNWMRQFGAAGGTVYLKDARPDLPHAVRFPFEDVVNNLWPERTTEGAHRTARPYLTSSISYMLALAIAEGFAEIAIVGVDMAADSEYQIQRPGCEYLIGLAKGRGIKVWLPEQCGLLEGPLYGRGSMNPEGERISTEQLSERLKRLEAHEAQAIGNHDKILGLVQQISGAIKNARDMLGEFPTAGPAIKARIDNLEGQLREAQQQHSQAVLSLNQVRGALIEVRYWIGLTPHGGDAGLLPPVLLSPGMTELNEGHGLDRVGVTVDAGEPLTSAAPRKGKRAPAAAAKPPVSCFDAHCSTFGCPPGRHGYKDAPNGAAAEALEVAAHA